MRSIYYSLLSFAFVILALSCEKLTNIEAPIDTITTGQVFSSDNEARAALAGIYSTMINSGVYGGAATDQFSAGLVTLLAGLSSDELDCTEGSNNPFFNFNANRLQRDEGNSIALWNTAFKVVYNANAVLEGIASSTSQRLTEGARKKMSGEAKFLRAFSYFYLTNFFGDVPLALTIDFNKTRNLPKTPQVKVYEQIVIDLIEAQTLLPEDNTSQAGQRIYPDRWAATALLARVYLYIGDYENAWKQSSAVIAQVSNFNLETDLNAVFLSGSREAIWQLKQGDMGFGGSGNATLEGYMFIPSSSETGTPFYFINYQLSTLLINAFEPDDQRKVAWVGSSDENMYNLPGTLYFPYKYKIGPNNNIPGEEPTELYTVLRLAEQYLIRAEAAANGAATLAEAIADLNVIRDRADLEDLPDNLTQPNVVDTIAHERRIELFAEWGHRWLDLKRTGQAAVQLPLIPIKKPWRGNTQLLYPIPVHEIQSDPFLIQNPGY